MSTSPRGRLVVAAVLFPLILASCTIDPSTGPVAISSATSSGVSLPGATFPSGAPSPTTASSPTVDTSRTTGSSAPSSPTLPSTTAVPAPRIRTSPADGADGISPTAPVTVRAQAGTFLRVALTNPEGRPVTGAFSAGRTVWTSTEPLGYRRKYTLTAGAVRPGAPRTESTSSFTTLSPLQTIYPSFFPNPTMKTVGVGQPMVIIFDKAPVDRVAAEKALSVKTVPAVKGSWFWWDDRTVHYRPSTHWKPGTEVTVSANLYGVHLGGGSYGEADRSMSVTIGPSRIATIDDATKQMQVFVDGRKVKTFPVSMGMDKEVTVAGQKISFVTPSGTYVAQEKYEVKQMSSASYGLPVNSSLGYDSRIPLAMRFSDGGIFVHAAPWSVADQGVRNVSHGCINLGPAAGRWFYDNFGHGDVMTVKGTSTRLDPSDGFGDWNISWDKWLAGSALA
ncbi:Ig-like domain-containing protein [Nakamurella sp. PAMC28650]|uniref:L,D-transpeptidase n=1 Tax=Nakamurella sp. PAMC28650 TaxID=2762325 RepID=UPI00164DD8BB|nr:Ig-like domain-containing protein [Nakamurella sp. PAMC28650]QNK80738.1 L,D-transpeptidase family protein [Nakamurella sp. PAMC28650]